MKKRKPFEVGYARGYTQAIRDVHYAVIGLYENRIGKVRKRTEHFDGDI